MAVVRMMARRFLLLLPTYINVYAVIMQQISYLVKREVYCNRNTPNPQYFPLLISGG